jgi:uncharacterized protein
MGDITGEILFWSALMLKALFEGLYRFASRPYFARAAERSSLLFLLVLANCLALPAWSETAAKYRVAFIGDSMADGYWDGVARLVDQDPCLKSRLDVLRFSKDSTGLHSLRYDWPSELLRINSRVKPNLFVLSIGANDFESDDKYKDRVMAFLEAAKKTEATLLWIGLPAMRVAAKDKDARDKNKLFEDAIGSYGNPRLEYVKPWKSKDVEEDKFTSYGPDRDKSLIQIRTNDGTHFTFPGNLITGTYLLPVILAALEREDIHLCGRTEAQAR